MHSLPSGTETRSPGCRPAPLQLPRQDSGGPRQPSPPPSAEPAAQPSCLAGPRAGGDSAAAEADAAGTPAAADANGAHAVLTGRQRAGSAAEAPCSWPPGLHGAPVVCDPRASKVGAPETRCSADVHAHAHSREGSPPGAWQPWGPHQGWEARRDARGPAAGTPASLPPGSPAAWMGSSPRAWQRMHEAEAESFALAAGAVSAMLAVTALSIDNTPERARCGTPLKAGRVAFCRA